MIYQRLEYIRSQFCKFPRTIYVGFSGGKDSSAVVKLLYTAQKTYSGIPPRIVAIYCDTGVENPIINAFVKTTILSLRKEARKDGVAFDCKVIAPQVDQSFFVRIIGRGYPPPTNSFRWCTKDIRIRPFQRFLRAHSDGTLIAVGTRIGESQQRDRSLRKSIDFKDEYKFYQKQRDGFAGAVLFTPIIDFDIDDV